ncbi:bifunctional lytic transglycosylase/C40 family peptidase [Ectobacillus ponti]|uniref:Lysozyme family protein n=1 Tax=Ectobacillus ponti TaxID=2961894 RepID=A0AA42BQ19_9BACI|nr:lysozyme family protein [Ectobacillus ponti]MCP8968951.1 lysozyme family protein [Ectobacillus ponti]
MYGKAVLLGARYWRYVVGAALLCLLPLFLLWSMVPAPSPAVPNSAGVSVDIWRWEPILREMVKREGLNEEHVAVLLAIIMQESGGTAADVMQSSESAGLPPGAITDPAASIRQGVAHWKNVWNIAKGLGITDLGTIVQAYNYGPGWLYYMKDNGGIGTEDLRKSFSRQHTNRTSCGWRSPYCYGDYTYAVKVMSFFQTLQGTASNDALYRQVMAEALKYKGWPYQWGGETPNTSFDCSGLLKWSFAAAGISLPRTAQEQYRYTRRINESELRPGDLVFFTGTSDHAFISHVGLYVGNGQMYNSNSSGVGYSDLRSAAWRSKIYGYGRVWAGGKQ